MSMQIPHKKRKNNPHFNNTVLYLNGKPVLFGKKMPMKCPTQNGNYSYQTRGDDEYIEVPADSTSIIYEGDDGTYEIQIDDLLDYDDDNEIQYTKSQTPNMSKQYLMCNAMLAMRASRMAHIH